MLQASRATRPGGGVLVRHRMILNEPDFARRVLINSVTSVDRRAHECAAVDE